MTRSRRCSATCQMLLSSAQWPRQEQLPPRHNPRKSAAKAQPKNDSRGGDRKGSQKPGGGGRGKGRQPYVAAPIPFHPGFPQGPAPTPSQAKAYQEAQSERRQEGRAEAQQTMAGAAANLLGGAGGQRTLQPTHITFSIAALRQAGMLTTDGRLILPPAASKFQEYERRLKDLQRQLDEQKAAASAGGTAPVVPPANYGSSSTSSCARTRARAEYRSASRTCGRAQTRC